MGCADHDDGARPLRMDFLGVAHGLRGPVRAAVLFAAERRTERRVFLCEAFAFAPEPLFVGHSDVVEAVHGDVGERAVRLERAVLFALVGEVGEHEEDVGGVVVLGAFDPEGDVLPGLVAVEGGEDRR